MKDLENRCLHCNDIITESGINQDQVEGYNGAEYCSECYYHDIFLVHAITDYEEDE